MADKLPKIGNITIPSHILDMHEVGADAMIDSLGKTCSLIYPEKVIECPNCYYDSRERRSTNIYKTGGPKPFDNNTMCPWCGGEGRSSSRETEDIVLRIYWSPKDWSTYAGTIENPEGVAQLIGYLKDLPKVERATEILLNSAIKGTKRYICQREGEATPWGMRQDRYFSQFVRRVGGG